MKYAIVYSSKTGNTKILAEKLRDMLPRKECVYIGSLNADALAADRLYIGFWTDKGTCDADTTAFLKTVRKKEVFLFGTAGFGGDQSYFDKILKKVQGHLNGDVKVIGSYMCQGKMPISVRDRYEKMAKAPIHMPNIEKMIENFDAALSHPDASDLKRLESDVRSVVEKGFV